MATGKNITQTVTTDFKALNAEGLQRTLENMIKKLDSIPTAAGKGAPVILKLAENLKVVSAALRTNELGSEAWITALKEVQNAMKTISTLASATKLFEKEDLENLKAFGREQKRIAKEAQEESRRLYDLRAKGRADEAAAQRKMADDALKAQAKLDEADRQARQRAGRAAQQERDYQNNLRARFEAQKATESARVDNSTGNAAKEERDRLANLRARGQLEEQASQERAGRAAKEERDYQNNLRARYEARQAAEAAAEAKRADAPRRRTQARAELATGEGAASLLLIQGALMANSALLSGAINTIKETISFSVQLEASFRNVQAVVGTTKTEMGQLEGVIKQVSTTTKFSALEVADAALILGQAGLSTKQITESITPVITLANASGSSIKDAVDLVTSVVGVFDKNSSDVADVANKITQAANSSKVSVDKLSLGFQYAGNTAAQLGISFEEVTAAMAAMSNAGIKSGSTMGTGLRQFLTEVQKPSENFLAILGRLGLSISDLDFRSKGFIGVVRTLKEAGFVAGDAIQSFDVRGAAAFNALLARPEDLQQQYDALNNTQAALKANEIQMDSLSAQGSRLTNTLGAMAATGFEPVIKSLTGLIRMLNDGLSAVTEWQLPLQILGTALAGLAAGVSVAWIVPLVGGIASVITGLQGATTAAGLMSVAFGSAAATMGIVGVAVAALVGLYTAYNYVAGESTRKIDEATAAMNMAKGAATENDEAITSLNNKLEQLAARSVSSKDESAELSRQIAESSTLVGKWGYSIDAATGSLGSLAVRLREVRGEMQKLRLANFQDVANEATKVADLETEKLKTAAGAAKKTFRYGGKLEGEDKFLNSVDPKERAAAQATLEGLKNGDTSIANGPALSLLVNQLSRFQKSGALTDSASKKEFATQFSAIESFAQQGGTQRNAALAASNATTTVNEASRNQAFAERLAANGVDLEAALNPGNLAARAKNELSEADRLNPIKITEKTDELVKAQTKLINATADRAIALAQGDKDIIAGIRQQVTSGTEKISTPLRDSLPAAKKAMEREDKYSSDNEEFSKISKRPSINAQDAARGEELIRAKFEKKFRRDAMGQTDDMKLSELRKDVDAEAKQEIEQFRDKVAEQGRRAGSAALKSQENSYKAVVDALMKDARSQRGRANANMSIEEIDTLMDEGLAKIAEAKKVELGSIARQYSAGSVEGRNLTAAANEKYEAAAQSFIGGFSGLLETVTERLYGVKNFLKQTDAQIKRLGNENEEELYRLSSALRDNDREGAINSGAVSGRRRSEVDAFNTANNRNPLELVNAQQRMAQIVTEQAQASAAKEEIDRRTRENRFMLQREERARDSLLAGRDATQLGSGEAAQLVNSTSQIAALTKIVTEGEAATEKYTNTLQKLRTEYTSLGNKAAGLTDTGPRPETYEELSKSVEKTVDAYRTLVSQQDQFKVIENGLFSNFQGVQGQFSSFFSSIVTGTATVGQAFKAMAANIIKSMVDVLAQALAMQAVKSILGAFTGAATGGTGITGGAVSFGASAGAGASASGFGTAALLRASGGPITGGTPGRDSVPVLAMPGEFMLKKSAVDVLGEDYLHDLNRVSASSVSQGSSGNGMMKGSSEAQRPLNIWVVSPDQVPSGGPDDIIATVTDNISRGGSLKKLIKSL